MTVLFKAIEHQQDHIGSPQIKYPRIELGKQRYD